MQRVVWRRISKALVDELIKEERPLVVILCIGNEERGDDGLGPYVAKKIKKLSRSNLIKVIDSGTVPENYTGVIRKLKPTHVIIVDAVDFGSSPGDVILSFEPKFDGVSISAHKPSLTMLAKYIEKSIGSKVILLGVQPKILEVDSKMTQEVLIAGDIIVKALKSTFRRLLKLKGESLSVSKQT
ncbi:MAG: hydrogenase maturation peptidase HycI [Thermoprotei archaeon]|nr:MAG: hydrogenase maturation peptidase HycI [Thermoprotei archaeon]